MSFFEPPPPRERPTRREPEWLGPPANVLPALFPLWLVLARTDRIAIQLHSGRAYRNGFEFALTLRRREEQPGMIGDPFHTWHEAQATGTIPDEALRFGIELADGAKATIFDSHRFFTTEERPDGPVLIGPPEHWVEVLMRFATDLGFGTFVLVAEPDGATLTSFIEDVAPQVRERGLPRTDLGPARGGQKPLRPDPTSSGSIRSSRRPWPSGPR